MQKIGQMLGYFTLVKAKGLLTILFGYDVKEWLFQGKKVAQLKSSSVMVLNQIVV